MVVFGAKRWIGCLNLNQGAEYLLVEQVKESWVPLQYREKNGVPPPLYMNMGTPQRGPCPSYLDENNDQRNNFLLPFVTAHVAVTMCLAIVANII
jgi:hypothetical protein